MTETVFSPNAYISLSSDAKMIQAAIHAAVAVGGRVIIPRHNDRTGKEYWDIDETLLVPSEIVIELENAHLRQADGAVCNLFAGMTARDADAMTPAKAQRDIHIFGVGKAILDGGIHNGLYEDNGISRKVVTPPTHHVSENCMLFFRNVEHLVIENLTILDQRYWGICMYACSYGRVANIRFISHSNVPTQDGVDLLKGCHDMIVENITGCIGDNAVALLATADSVYLDVGDEPGAGDIYNITIRNIMVYGVGGCALTRILNHDGYKIYNIMMDNLIETSPWSEDDASVAENPDLHICSDDEGKLLPVRPIVPGEIGYRTEAAILIGENYWYGKYKARHGDTYGITVRNVTTHARFAVSITNTLLDSSFDHIRLFGNGYMAAYFGEGTIENVTFSNVSWDKNAHPHKEDEHIYIDWNNVKADGFSAFYFHDARPVNVLFDRISLMGSGIHSVFGGYGSGAVEYAGLRGHYEVLSDAEGIEAKHFDA